MLPPPIRYFVEIARCGSIREASQRLRVAPSALSRQIQNLEQELGTPLFERRPRGMALTAAGELYARYAQAVSLEADRLRTEVDALRGLRRGIVRIATVEGVIADMLTKVVAAFRDKHPGIRVNVAAIGTDDVIASVRDGKADVGLSFHAKPDAAVRFVRRVRDPLAALLHPDHALARRKQVSLTEVMSYPVAVPEPGFGIRRLIDEQCRRLGLSMTPALETNSIEALRGFARSGAGISMLPGVSFQPEVRRGEIAAVAIADRALNQCSMDISVLAGRHLPAAIVQFVAMLEEHLMSTRNLARTRIAR